MVFRDLWGIVFTNVALPQEFDTQYLGPELPASVSLFRYHFYSGWWHAGTTTSTYKFSCLFWEMLWLLLSWINGILLFGQSPKTPHAHAKNQWINGVGIAKTQKAQPPQTKQKPNQEDYFCNVSLLCSWLTMLMMDSCLLRGFNFRKHYIT